MLIRVVEIDFGEVFKEDSFSIDFFKFRFVFHSMSGFPGLKFREGWSLLILIEEDRGCAKDS